MKSGFLGSFKYWCNFKYFPSYLYIIIMAICESYGIESSSSKRKLSVSCEDTNFFGNREKEVRQRAEESERDRYTNTCTHRVLHVPWLFDDLSMCVERERRNKNA